jgi:hypothetical protein
VATTPDPGLHRLWAWLGSVAGAGLGLAGLAALGGWGPAGWILVAALAALVAGHVWISAVSYRRTMRREWPRVEPLTDDD